ncbi:uncharacterized protein LOC117909081 [Vitis riparia]|uniref:uncharacterized protein LOC117909081 n=1 Tax=Vitis riparia TaxID=96939 RepID=UPI00155A4A23|nr:uncharacterized protein LOC117909081 [Vitis riparia]
MRDFDVRRILIDPGSSTDLLQASVVNQMGLELSGLENPGRILSGFNGTATTSLGDIVLPVQAGPVTLNIQFSVVRDLSPFNVILGRMWLHYMKVIPSTYHQMVSFLTKDGQINLYGNQLAARQCYQIAREQLLNPANKDPPTADLLRTIQISEESTHLTHIKSLLTPEEAQDIHDALRQSHDVFAWAHSNMKRIHPSVASHREVEYPDWLANVVVVPKNEGKWRVCVDYTNLNNACPKDSFSLPRIDQIVDSTAGQGMLSFLDTFSGYHQIPMAPVDEEKTTFIMPYGLYCYKVMPFELKNVGATYQTLMTKIFKPLVGRIVEVYIDDIVVKSKTRGEHALHLQEVFHLLRKYGMKLNPSKYAFSISAGKFLGFMVSQTGIEINPDQVKAVMETPPPRSKKELQRLTGKLVALGRFIAWFTDELRPFFLAIRKVGTTGWTDSCQSAFEKIKHYLTQPPILSNPLSGEKLYMYLAVSEWAISVVLFRCPSHREQKPIYYVSKALADVETKYSKMEQTTLALRSAAQKLRPYFQAHPVVVLIDQPLRNILHKPDLTGRMLQWAIELNEYGIEYQQRLSMKEQVMADFVVEYPQKPAQHKEPREEEWWTMRLEQAIRLGFPASNNEAEYEVILSELDLALALSVSKLRIYSDSQLVRFAEWTVKKIPRTDNVRADTLIAASFPIKEAILLPIHVQIGPSITEASTCNTIEASQGDDQEWTEVITRYLRIGTLPEEPKQAHKIRVQAARFTLIGGHLYKRSFTGPYLKCLDHSEALYVLAELHEDVCGNHSKGRSLAHRAHSQGYYWPRMKKDTVTYVKKCDKSQRHAPIPHAPSETLKPISSPWPFAQ